MTTIIDLIISVYGRESPLKFTCGKVHENLEMTIDFYEKGKIKFTMYDYINDTIEELPEDTKIGEAETPSGYHLLTTEKYDPEKLSKGGTINFHHLTENLLYMAKKDRPYMQLGVALFCTSVKYPY